MFLFFVLFLFLLFQLLFSFFLLYSHISQEFPDLDWVNYLEKFHADGKEPRLTNIQKNEQITFFEHKSVAILYPELVKEFLKTKPKEWQMYIETMYSMAAGVEKKYWKFLRDNLPSQGL